MRTVTGTGIFCFTSPVIARGRRGISLMARARGPGWPEGANVVNSTFSENEFYCQVESKNTLKSPMESDGIVIVARVTSVGQVNHSLKSWGLLVDMF